MTFVTEDLRTAVTEAEEFENEDIIYHESMCLKPTSGGVKEKTFIEALQAAKKYMSEEDIAFYHDCFNKNRKSRCVLPKGHKGRCRCSYETFFTDKFAKKIHDCVQAAGNSDILFKNRSHRAFPIQVTKEQYTVLNELYKWKASNVKLKAAMPTEFGSTSFIVATAIFDFTAILMLQKGIEHELPEDIESKLLDRAKDIVKEFKQQGIRIVDENGYLCCPIIQKTIEPEWYDNRDDDFQIQFGHVNPVRSDKYMTRGGNLLPITRAGNTMQLNRTISETYDYIQQIAKELNTFR
tara:strand:+ start:316 stop:1197 length:882 start_codon:yes stop_codon:yes gene_type:complete